MLSKTLSRSVESVHPSLGLYVNSPVRCAFHRPRDRVRPSFWHPASALEQSMVELEHMSDLMRRSRFPFEANESFFAIPSNIADEEFFKDLPVKASNKQSESRYNLEDAKETKPVEAQIAQAKADESPASTKPHRAFSSCSFSTSSVVDDKGQHVTRTRRRYADSTGRLKAVHERQLGDKKLRSEWQRQSAKDKGQHEAVCSNGSADEFEALWRRSPFGKAEEQTTILGDAKKRD